MNQPKKKIKDINDINTNTEEGKLLTIALTIITTTQGYSDKTPDQVINELYEMHEVIHGK
ncbi:MAG: hypothetical protein PVH88_09060 [Ignavibacteria bacterium]|jgi:hypothetical protein